MFFRRRRKGPKIGGDLPQTAAPAVAPEGLAQASAQLVVGRVADLRPPGHVLVIGIGHGGLALALAQLWPKARIVGLDASTDRVRQANHAAVEAGVSGRVRFQPANLRSLNFPDQSSDLVVATGFLGVVSYPGGALNEVCRLLTPGGVGFLVEALETDGRNYARVIPFRTPEGSSCEKDLRALCDRVGVGIRAHFEVLEDEAKSAVGLIVLERLAKDERAPH